MSPLQQIAMGLVVVIGRAVLPPDPTPSWQRYDVLADPVGWVLVVLGVWRLARADERFESLRWPALVAGAVSVPLWLPQLNHLLDASGQWAASLPQIVFCLLLARQISAAGATRTPPDEYAAGRFRLLVAGFALVAVLPVVAIGGGVDALRSPTDAVSAFVNLANVYFLFRVHRREWLGGPGQLEVRPPAKS